MLIIQCHIPSRYIIGEVQGYIRAWIEVKCPCVVVTTCIGEGGYAETVGSWREVRWWLRDNGSLMNNFSHMIAVWSLGVAKNIWTILLLLRGRPFVAPNPLNAAISCSFHHQLFIHTWCMQSSGCSRSKWVVGLISLDTCILAHVRHKILRSIVSHCRTRKPALCGVVSQRG